MGNAFIGKNVRKADNEINGFVRVRGRSIEEEGDGAVDKVITENGMANGHVDRNVIVDVHDGVVFSRSKVFDIKAILDCKGFRGVVLHPSMSYSKNVSEDV